MTELPARRRKGWWLLSGALALGTCAGVLCARNTRVGDDDFTALLRAYSTAVRDLEDSDPTKDARRQFCLQWLRLFMGEYDKLPPGSVPDAARVTCLTLANGVQDYDIAESIALDGAIFAPSWRQQLVYWDQRVGLREAIAARTGAPDDLAAIRALADEAILVIRPTLGEPLYASDPVSVLSVQRILRVAANRAGADGDLLRATSLLEEAADFVSELPLETVQSIGFNWWPDQCLQDAARYRIHAGDIQGASAMLRRIDSCETKRASASEHALICAGEAVPLGNFREDFARAWLRESEPWDANEVRLAYALAFSILNGALHDHDQLQEAVSLLEAVLLDGAMLAEADAAVAGPLLESGRAPHTWVVEPITSNVLVCLARAYKALGWDDECADVAGMVVADYPEHPAVSLMRGMSGR